MLFALYPGIRHPYNRTFAWCQKVSDVDYKFHELPDGKAQIIGLKKPLEAYFEGGRIWPDISANGGTFPLNLFSEAAVDVLGHYDTKALISEPLVVKFHPNKSLVKTGPPIYRTFQPSISLPRSEVNSGASSPALFIFGGRGSDLVANEYVVEHIKKARLRNFVIEPLDERLAWIDRVTSS